MHRLAISTLMFLAAASFAAGQSNPPAASQSTPKGAPQPLTLSGCVQPSDSSPTRFTFEDDTNPKAAETYRLSGTNMKKYSGQRVEIIGGVVTPKLKISGGLRPSANVAGQAGAMDPTQAVIAGSSGGAATGTGNSELPEFRVTSVKTLGACKP